MTSGLPVPPLPSPVAPQHNGFTLVELAIVLVIIGLIIGGVIVGASLVRAAQVNRVIAESEKVKTAIFTFEGKYSAVPGDMKNATYYFAAEGSCPNNPSTSNYGTTCNGNGDGIILSGASQYSEEPLLWEHLALEGLIPCKCVGAYNGVVGEERPAGPISGSVWNAKPVAWNDTIYSKAVDTYNVFALTTISGSGSGPLNAQEAQSIDLKLDDGLASSGKIYAINKNAARNNCVDAAWNAASSANYITNGVECKILFFY